MAKVHPKDGSKGRLAFGRLALVVAAATSLTKPASTLPLNYNSTGLQDAVAKWPPRSHPFYIDGVDTTAVSARRDFGLHRGRDDDSGTGNDKNGSRCFVATKEVSHAGGSRFGDSVSRVIRRLQLLRNAGQEGHRVQLPRRKVSFVSERGSEEGTNETRARGPRSTLPNATPDIHSQANFNGSQQQYKGEVPVGGQGGVNNRRTEAGRDDARRVPSRSTGATIVPSRKSVPDSSLGGTTGVRPNNGNLHRILSRLRQSKLSSSTSLRLHNESTGVVSDGGSVNAVCPDDTSGKLGLGNVPTPPSGCHQCICSGLSNNEDGVPYHGTINDSSPRNDTGTNGRNGAADCNTSRAHGGECLLHGKRGLSSGAGPGRSGVVSNQRARRNRKLLTSYSLPAKPGASSAGGWVDFSAGYAHPAKYDLPAPKAGSARATPRHRGGRSGENEGCLRQPPDYSVLTLPASGFGIEKGGLSPAPGLLGHGKWTGGLFSVNATPPHSPPHIIYSNEGP